MRTPDLVSHLIGRAKVSNLFEPESYFKGTESYEGLLDSQTLPGGWLAWKLVTGKVMSFHIVPFGSHNSLPVHTDIQTCTNLSLTVVKKSENYVFFLFSGMFFFILWVNPAASSRFRLCSSACLSKEGTIVNFPEKVRVCKTFVF